MKLRGEQLDANLKRGLAPIWLISGDEPLLTDEAGARIRAAARAQGYDERQSFQSETGFDWKGWMAGFDSLSLFSSRRLIELRLPTGKPGIEGGKTLEAWAANPPADIVLLITTPKLDKATLATKWAGALEARGVLMQAARVWDSRQALVERALQRAGSGGRGAAGAGAEAQRLRRLAWAMRGFSRLDRAAKGLLREDAWDELKQLGLALMNQGKAPAFTS